MFPLSFRRKESGLSAAVTPARSKASRTYPNGISMAGLLWTIASR